MTNVISSTDLVRLLKSYVSPVSRVSSGTRVGLVYNRLLINTMSTYSYEAELPINTGFCLGLDSDVVKAVLSVKEKEISTCEIHPQMYNNPSIVAYLVSLMERYHNEANSLRRTVSFDDLSCYEEFQNAIQGIKASDGCRFVKFYGEDLYDRYLIPVFAGFPNLNKGDTMGINIYRHDPTCYISEYFIHKKKIKTTYHCFARHRDLDRPLIQF